MADFDSHVLQAKRNLEFIGSITSTENFEWQVTISFYVAVHLINAHLARSSNLHYRTHNQVEYHGHFSKQIRFLEYQMQVQL